MKRFTVILFALLFLIPVVASAQEWTNTGAWGQYSPDSVLHGSTHGIAVDPDGNIWVTNFFTTASHITVGGDTVAVVEIYVFGPDGNQTDISPIRAVTIDGVEYPFIGSNGRGLRQTVDGNILHAQGSRLYLIDYQTGEGIATIVPPDSTSLDAAAVDANGLIYTAHVLPGNQINIWDSGLGFVETAIAETQGFSRAFEVSDDGNTIYWGGFTTHVLEVFSRDSEFDPFPTDPDTVLYGINPESFAWHPTTGHLWMSSGSYNDLPNRFPEMSTSYRPNVWYAFDVSDWSLQDSLEWIFTGDPVVDANERPRAIDFSPDGSVAYIGCFGDNRSPALQRVTFGTSVRPDDRPIAERFTLSQNYPNPFNPTTEINFNINMAGFTTLKVYDMLGREVATLIDRHLDAGAYIATFDAKNLPSGTYIYVLDSAGQRMTKKMLLLK